MLPDKSPSPSVAQEPQPPSSSIQQPPQQQKQQQPNAPTGFSPPTNAKHRKYRSNAVVLTANSAQVTTTTSQDKLELQQYFYPPPPPSHNSHHYHRQQQKHQQQHYFAPHHAPQHYYHHSHPSRPHDPNNGIVVMGQETNATDADRRRYDRQQQLQSNKNEKPNGLLRSGPPPPIASISADLDLAAKEEHSSRSNNDTSDNQQQHQESPCQDTLNQIDALVAVSGDHDEDTDLGFDFTASPPRDDTNKHKEPSFYVVMGTPSQKNAMSKTEKTPLKLLSSLSSPSPSFRSNTMRNQQPKMHPYNSMSQFGGFHTGYNRNGSIYNTQPHRGITSYKGSNIHHHQLEGQIEVERSDHKVNEGNDKMSPTLSEGKMSVPHSASIKVDDHSTKKTLLRSPPVKKRPIVASWDDKIGKKEKSMCPIGSPSNVFRSPRHAHYKQSPNFSRSGSFGASFDMDASPTKLNDMFPSSNSFESGENLVGIDKNFLDGDSSPNIMFDSMLSPFRVVPSTYTPGSEKCAPSSSDFLQMFESIPTLSPMNHNFRYMQPNQNLPKIPLSCGSSGSANHTKNHNLLRSNTNRLSPQKIIIPKSSPSPLSYVTQVGSMTTTKTPEMKREVAQINDSRQGKIVHKVPNSNNKLFHHETPMRPLNILVSTPSTGNKITRYPASSPKLDIPRNNQFARIIHASATPTQKRPGNGKENASPAKKRNPCNCKKSHCLKLYCVCFQSKMNCDGCNCLDCKNTQAFDDIRLKAIKDTVAKNPNAFKTKFSSKQKAASNASCNPSPSQSHNMGCKCKKSLCLKKYCECFEAGVICSDRCKCIECQNFVGSQQLIDRRRKIKDHRGAELAMQSSHDVWKRGIHTGMRNAAHGHHTSMPSPAAHLGQHPGALMYSMSMISPPPGGMHPGALPHHFMGRSPMMMPPIGYHSIGMHQPITPYSVNESHSQMLRNMNNNRNRPIPSHFQPKQISKAKTTAKTRKGFNPHLKKKQDREDENKMSYFGQNNASQTKTTALTVFSFLSNDDIYNASLVCHVWTKLSLDEELWQFEEATS